MKARNIKHVLKHTQTYGTPQDVVRKKILGAWPLMASPPWRLSMLKVQKRPRATLPVDVALAWFDGVDEVTQPATATA